MSHAVLAAVVIPIVVAIALAFWITAVYHAQRHPAKGRKGNPGPPREIAGGSFRGHGGRQVMPLPNTEPDPELDQSAPAGEQSYARTQSGSRRDN